VYLKDITGTLGNELSGKRVAHCVTGSISITEAPRIARLLMRHGCEVIPVLTPKAAEFVSPMIFEWSTGNPPITKLTGRVEHVELVSPESPKRVDLILIAPCTANTIGKISSGVADEPVSTLACTALGSGIPILIASAMHEPMAKNPVIRQAMEKLEKVGVKFIEGRLVESKSKLAEPEEIVQAVISEIGSNAGRRGAGNALTDREWARSNADNNSLAGYSVTVTAGPTREPIDQVRFISNASSGKMGVALAEEALSRGAKRVNLIHGPGVVVPDALLKSSEDGRVRISGVVTSQEMQDAVLSVLSGGDGEHDVLISAGAPADYTSLAPSRGKISTSDKPTLRLELKATKKIISVAKEKFPKAFVVAFKAEHVSEGDPAKLTARALETLRTSGAEIVVANDIGKAGIGFGSDFNEVLVLTRDGKARTLTRASKKEIAAKILDILGEEIRRSKQY